MNRHSFEADLRSGLRDARRRGFTHTAEAFAQMLIDETREDLARSESVAAESPRPIVVGNGGGTGLRRAQFSDMS